MAKGGMDIRSFANIVSKEVYVHPIVLLGGEATDVCFWS